MGNQSAKSGAGKESEMSSSRHFERSEEFSEPLCPLSELELDCKSLHEGVQNLSYAIDEIFEEDENVDEPYGTMEERLYGMTRLNQSLALKLMNELERHAKEVGAGQEKNERVMSSVRFVVDVVNRYMAMLVLNIRKLKRLMSEMDKTWASRDTNRKVHRALYLPQKEGARQTKDWVYDVISDQQDVDAMLLGLLNTREQREDLEKDMITVLVFWRDYKYIRERESDKTVIDKIEENVLAAADSISAGVPRLKRSLT